LGGWVAHAPTICLFCSLSSGPNLQQAGHNCAKTVQTKVPAALGGACRASRGFLRESADAERPVTREPMKRGPVGSPFGSPHRSYPKR
jgi:hypothetical protein